MLDVKTLNELFVELGPDFRTFLPELILCAGIVWMLLCRVFSRRARTHLGATALTFTLLALLVSYLQWMGKVVPDPPKEKDGLPDLVEWAVRAAMDPPEAFDSW